MTEIEKYRQYKTSELKKMAINVFHRFIRERDKGKNCITCPSTFKLQAGHFYSGGKFNHMRFLEDNAHGQCLSCNYYDLDFLPRYRKNLIGRIGVQRVAILDRLAHSQRTSKDDRSELIAIIERYTMAPKAPAQ